MASNAKFQFSEGSFNETFESMFRNGELTDVTVKIGETIFRGHRIILAAAFPYFRTLFKRQPLDNRDKKITLRNIDPDAFKCLLNYAYTGKISIVSEDVKKLLTAANHLQHIKIRKACFEFLSEQFSVENVLDLRTLGNSMNCYEFVKKADSFIGENFELLRKTQEFLNAPFELLMEIVSRNDIKVEKTENVYKAISRWLKADPERTRNFMDLVYCVQKELSFHRCVNKNEVYDIPAEIPPRTLLDLPSYDDVFGIYTVSSSASHNRIVHNYNFYTSSWSRTALHNQPRSFTTVVSACGLIFAFTGEQLEFFDGCHWTICGTLPWDVKTRSGNAVTRGNEIFWFPNIMDRMCSVWCFNVRYQKWRPQALSVKLISPGLVSFGRYIYVLGGLTSSEITESAMTYDPNYEEFKYISPMLRRRCNPRCAALNDKVYVCGGYCGHSFLDSVEVYDSLDEQWKFVSPMKKKWANFSIVPCQQKLFLIGKRDDDDDADDTVAIYDPEENLWQSGPKFPDRWSSLKAVTIST